MTGQVKYVYSQDEWVDNNSFETQTCYYAVLQDGAEVQIDEDEVADYYSDYNEEDWVAGLNGDLQYAWIEYYEDDDGDYCLDGDLKDVIAKYHGDDDEDEDDEDEYDYYDDEDDEDDEGEEEEEEDYY